MLRPFPPRFLAALAKEGDWHLAESSPNHVTELLGRWQAGDEFALRDLVPVVYGELRRLAHYPMQGERPGHTLQSTALVHEAYVRLIGSARELHTREHFFAVASRLMRQILVDYARARNAAKRDGGFRVSLSDVAHVSTTGDEELPALDRALDELARIDERQAKIVELRFFGGLSSSAVARVLGFSRATVDRDWSTARLWLHRQISSSP